jgi:hypothetical protein
VSLPEVRLFYDRAVKQENMEKDARNLMIRIIRNELNDPQLLEETRRDLESELEKRNILRGKIRGMKKDLDAQAPMPITRDVENRSRALERQLKNIMRVQQAKPDSAEINELKEVLSALNEEKELAIKRMHIYEAAENKAVVIAAQTQLREDG